MQDIKATLIWITLVALTLLMFFMAQSDYQKQSFAIMILVSAWFKGQMIIDHFMGLRRVETLWRMVVSVWLIIVLGTILSVYLWA